MGTPRRSSLIAGYPFPFRRIVRTVLDLCGDCPERLWCMERLLGGDLSKLLPDPARCSPASYAGPVSRQAAKFVRENCVGCRAKEACAEYLSRHVLRLSALDDGAIYREGKERISEVLRRCGPCPRLSRCVQGSMLRNRLSIVRLLRNFARMIMQCEKGVRSWAR